MSDPRFIGEERISLAGVINNFKSWFMAMLAAWKRILIITLIIGGLFFAYHTLKKVNYTAATTFVLETDSGSGLGQLSSIANLAGVNVGALTENSTLFQLDNIVELYRSFAMMRKTLLSTTNSDVGNERLITWYGREHELQSDWEKHGVNFEMPEEQMVIRHDSILKEVAKVILERNLDVGKTSRKLSILRVAYTSDNQLLSKVFNEILVEHVNDFYSSSKTKKTSENLRVLSYQADSVKVVVDELLEDLALFDDSNPNLNPLRTQALVPRQKILIDLQAATVIYQEIVKNHEIAKVAHRNNTPLIQIIDKPILPLEDDAWKWYKSLIIGLFIGGVLAVAYSTVQRAYRIIMDNAS